MPMTSNGVDEWFEGREHPMEEAMQRVRAIILETDPRIEETIEWKTPTFMFNGNIASFNPAKKFVSLLPHQGVEIPGKHPRLEGEGDTARVMRFSDGDDAEANCGALEAVIQASCEWKVE